MSLFFLLYGKKTKSFKLTPDSVFFFIEATTQEDIEAKVNNLQKQMYVITGQLHQICDTMAKFVKCKSCQKKLYKSSDDSDVSLEDVGFSPVSSTPATLHVHRFQATPMPVASSSP